MSTNLLVITYYLIENNVDISCAEDDDTNCTDDEDYVPIVLTDELRKRLKKFVDERDVKFWKGFYVDDSVRDLICDSLQVLIPSFIGKYYYTLISPISDKITSKIINSELEGVFAGWYDSDPMIMEEYKVIPNVEIARREI